MSSIADLLKRVWRPPINVDIWPADVDKHYKTWGFTLYRISYDPQFDHQWKLLIDKISTKLLARLRREEDRGEDPNDTSKFWNLFKLDARSDPATLDGLTRDEVCQIHRDTVGGLPMEMMTSLNPDHQIFLLADEEVLQDPGLDVLKVVQADYNPGEYEVDSPQRYCGWMTMHPRSLIDFWDELENADSLSDFVWIELPGAFWEP